MCPLNTHQHFVFTCSSKRANILKRWFKAAGTKLKELLRDVETRWLSLLPPLQRVLELYPCLLVGFDQERESALVGAAADASLCYNHLVDLENVLSIILMLVLLKELSTFCKVCQRREVFLHDLAASLQYTKDQLCTLFIDPETRYKGVAFKSWAAAVKVKLASNMVWDADKELAIKVDVTMAVGQAAMRGGGGGGGGGGRGGGGRGGGGGGGGGLHRQPGWYVCCVCEIG